MNIWNSIVVKYFWSLNNNFNRLTFLNIYKYNSITKYKERYYLNALFSFIDQQLLN